MMKISIKREQSQTSLGFAEREKSRPQVKYKTKFLSVLVLLCAVVQGAWAWEGSGTEADPWLIKTTADLGEIAKNVNSGAMTYAKKYFKLCNDINAAAMVGKSETKSFQGIFDGGGHNKKAFYKLLTQTDINNL
ncbi:MAG: hypothetical protein IJ868_08230 [Prevotella sp.]|nr:hypothetical protein [Prevotella sp.]